jgi:serine/threonine-protein kinase
MITPKKDVVIAGRYKLVRRLKRGGMGEVWVAQDPVLADRAIKFMDPSLAASTEARTRFEREASAVSHLNSQHVVHVYDYGVEEKTPYIVMELLKGESLQDRLAQEGRLPLGPDLARLLMQICTGLGTAHAAGLVHRDLKPDNIFLALKDGEEVVQILDFGIAKTTAPGAAQVTNELSARFGSVHYMSPEQVRETKNVDRRSDLWSVGVILYRSLTGLLPFPGESPNEVMASVMRDPYAPLSSVAPDLPPWLENFFVRALARELDKRFQSAQELAEAFSSMAMDAPAQQSSRQSPANRTQTSDRPIAAKTGDAEVANDGSTEKLPPLDTQPVLDSAVRDPMAAVPYDIASRRAIQHFQPSKIEAGVELIPTVRLDGSWVDASPPAQLAAPATSPEPDVPPPPAEAPPIANTTPTASPRSTVRDLRKSTLMGPGFLATPTAQPTPALLVPSPAAAQPLEADSAEVRTGTTTAVSAQLLEADSAEVRTGTTTAVSVPDPPVEPVLPDRKPSVGDERLPVRSLRLVWVIAAVAVALTVGLVYPKAKAPIAPPTPSATASAPPSIARPDDTLPALDSLPTTPAAASAASTNVAQPPAPQPGNRPTIRGGTSATPPIPSGLPTDRESVDRETLEARMNAGKASLQQLRALKAICASMHDRECMNRAREAIEKKKADPYD